MITSHCYGHATYYDRESDTWRYLDTGEPVTPHSERERPCPKCGKPPTPEGYDACLGHIPGAISACCGHGVYEGAIWYEDGRREKLPIVGTEREVSAMKEGMG